MMKKHLRMAIATLLVLVSGTLAFAQNKVTGTVKDANGEPIVAASVVIRGTTIGAVTDLDGNYTLNVPANSVLEASCIGYTSQTVNYANQSVVNFVLSEDALFLDETVVIGYQTVKRRDLTGSVASVNSKQLTAAPVANVAQALQGKMPGVNIVSQDGRPGATMNIRVRGGGSISQSNDPLILIDGVAGTLADIPSDQVESIDVLKDASSTAIYGARGANGVILVTTKGAKEGKVRVTYSGYAKFNTPTKYLQALGPYDYLYYVWANAYAHDQSYAADPFTELYGIGQYGDINRYKNVQQYDVQKEVYNSSFSHSHDLSISGGTESTKVLVSANWNDENGMKIASWQKRGNLSFKINQKISDRLNVAMDLRYTDMTSFGYEGTGSRSGSVLSSSYRYRPIATDIIRQYGNLDALQKGAVEQYGKGVLWDVYDPVKQLLDYEPEQRRQALRGTFSLNWNIVKGLTYHTDLSAGRAYNQNKTWSGAIRNNFIDDATGEKQHAGNATVFQGNSWTMRWTNTLNYELELNEANRFNFLVGQEVSNTGGDSMTITADHFPANFTKENAFTMIDQFDESASTVTRKFYTGYSTPERILSFFGRVNYTLLDRYLFTVTFRADGSSKFAPSHRWGYFPAAAFAWRASEEPFLKDVNWLNELKFRLSYGTVGNDRINSDLWSQSWKADAAYYSIDNAKYGTYTIDSSMANPNLKWETTITRDFGIDFGLFNGRLSGTVDLYWNSTKDLLMNMTLPAITGFTSTYANIGQTSNKGVELSLNAILIQTRDWGLTFGGNINFNKNNIDALSENVTPIYGSSRFHSGNPGNDYGLFVGKPVGLVRGLIFDGLYQVSDFNYDPATHVYTLKDGIPDLSGNIAGQWYETQKFVPSGQTAYPGLPKFKDQPQWDKEKNEYVYDGVIDDSDYTVIGDTNPLFTGGFNLTANYKNWDFGAYFNYSVGNKIYNITKLATLNGYKESGLYENHLGFMKDSFKIYDIQGGQLVRVHEPAALQALNANATLPVCTNENGIISTLGIEDGSYLRLNTLTTGYTVPSNSAFAKTLNISNLRVYATIYNLFTLTKYSGLDPEVSTAQNINGAQYPTPGIDWGAYPRARSFVLGVNVSF